MGHGELSCSGVAITIRGLSTFPSIIGIKIDYKIFLRSERHFELITVNSFFAKCNLGGSANEHYQSYFLTIHVS